MQCDADYLAAWLRVQGDEAGFLCLDCKFSAPTSSLSTAKPCAEGAIPKEATTERVLIAILCLIAFVVLLRVLGLV